MQKQPVGPIYFNLLHHCKEWEGEIAPLLGELSKGEMKSEKIIEMLMLFNGRYCWRRASLYGRKPKRECEYSALRSLYEQQLPSICRQFASALLRMRPQKIPLVMGQVSTRLNYKKKDFVYLLLLMFFSLVPKQYSDHSQYLQKRFHDKNNFAHILQHSLFKTQCIVEYLLIAVKEIVQHKQDELLTIVRRVQPKNKLQSILLTKKQAPMSKITLESNDKSIEQYNGDIKIDFANRFIGGGCLNDGCVQEEIMFAVRPELYATTLLCQKMEDNQALAFIGFRRYFDHSGYGSTTKFESLAKIQYKMDQNYQAEQYIAAIDAVKFKQGGLQQFQRRFIDRQILKAYLGFSALEVEGRIVTGGWGCGVYHGDIQAKILIQWIAASLAGRQMIFCPFGKKHILEQRNLLQKLKEGKIIQIYRLLIQACEQKMHAKNATLFNLASEIAPKM